MKFKSYIVAFFMFSLLGVSVELFSYGQGDSSPSSIEKNLKNKGGKRVVMQFNKGSLFCDIKGGGRTQTSFGGNVFGYNTGWKFKVIDPGLFSLKYFTWRGYCWYVETRTRKIYRVNTDTGRRAEVKNAEVKLLGDAPANMPDSIILVFNRARVIYKPDTKEVTGYFDKNRVVDSSKWDGCNLQNSLYFLREKNAQGYYVINPQSRRLYLVSNIQLDFCKELNVSSNVLAIREFRLNEAGNIVLPMKEVTVSCLPKSLQCGVIIRTTNHGHGDKLRIDRLENWEVSRLSNSFYHIKHKKWRGFFWAVNTRSERVYRVTRGTFGVRSGESSRIMVNVKTTGGEGGNVPDAFIIKFRSAQMVYSVDSNMVNISAKDTMLAGNYEFDTAVVADGLYHVKAKNWEDKYIFIKSERRSAQIFSDRFYGRLPDKRKRVENVTITISD